MAIAHDLGFESDLDVDCFAETFAFVGGHGDLRGGAGYVLLTGGC